MSRPASTWKICLLAAATLWIDSTHAANILAMFLFPSYSHQTPMLAVSKALAARGHNLTVITTNPCEVQIANHTEIDISFAYELLRGGKLKVKFQSKMNPFRLMINSMHGSVKLPEFELKSPPVQNFLRWAKDVKFDLVLCETLWMTPMLAMVYALGSPPVVGLSSMESNPFLDYGTGSPANLAYAPNNLPISDHMTFFDRLYNVAYYCFCLFYMYRYLYPEQDRLIREVFGDGAPSTADLVFNNTLVIHSSDNSMTYAQATTPNIVHVGPLHLVPPKPLPDDLEKWVSGAEDGVIYFSLGSNMKGTSVPVETRQAFLTAFSRFPKYRVIWKCESDTTVLDGHPNIQLKKWIPQQDLLAHRKVKLFITQCGLQSMQEAIHNAVPVVCIPLYGDQEMHARKVDYARVGLVLDFYQLTTDVIHTAVNDVLNDPTYKQNMRRMSDVSRSRMMTPVEEAVWWVEHVLKFDGAPHLRPATKDLHWSQRLLLDVAAFVIAIACIVLFVVYKVLKFIYHKCLTLFIHLKLKQM